MKKNIILTAVAILGIVCIQQNVFGMMGDERRQEPISRWKKLTNYGFRRKDNVKRFLSKPFESEKWKRFQEKGTKKVGSMRKAIGKAKNKISGGFSSGFSKVKTGVTQGRSFGGRFFSRKQVVPTD